MKDRAAVEGHKFHKWAGAREQESVRAVVQRVLEKVFMLCMLNM